MSRKGSSRPRSLQPMVPKENFYIKGLFAATRRPATPRWPRQKKKIVPRAPLRCHDADNLHFKEKSLQMCDRERTPTGILPTKYWKTTTTWQPPGGGLPIGTMPCLSRQIGDRRSAFSCSWLKKVAAGRGQKSFESIFQLRSKLRIGLGSESRF